MKRLPLALILTGIVGVGQFRYAALHLHMRLPLAALIAFAVALVVAWIATDFRSAAVSSISLLLVSAIVVATNTSDPNMSALFSLMLLALPFGAGFGLRKEGVRPLYGILLFFLQGAAVLFGTCSSGDWPLLWGVAGTSLIALVAWVEHKFPTSVRAAQ